MASQGSALETSVGWLAEASPPPSVREWWFAAEGVRFIPF